MSQKSAKMLKYYNASSFKGFFLTPDPSQSHIGWRLPRIVHGLYVLARFSHIFATS